MWYMRCVWLVFHMIRLPDMWKALWVERFDAWVWIKYCALEVLYNVSKEWAPFYICCISFLVSSARWPGVILWHQVAHLLHVLVHLISIQVTNINIYTSIQYTTLHLLPGGRKSGFYWFLVLSNLRGCFLSFFPKFWEGGLDDILSVYECSLSS